MILRDEYDSSERIEVTETENLDRPCVFINQLDEVGIFIGVNQAEKLVKYLTEFINRNKS